MKIAIWHNLHSGGGKRAMHDQIRGLLAQGHEVEVWSPPTKDRDFLPISELVSEHCVPLDWNPLEQASPLSALFSKNRSIPRKIAALEAHCKACASEINAGGFDLLFCQPCYYSGCPPIARYTRIPSIIFLHEPYRMLYEAHDGPLWAANDFGTVFAPKNLVRSLKDQARISDYREQVRFEYDNARAFDRILANSYFSRESILRSYGVDSHVCYIGVDTDKFEFRHQEREPFVVGVGAFSPAKNQRFVIEAIGLMPDPKPRLVWVGNANLFATYVDDLKKRAAELKICFEPIVMASDETLIDLLNRAMAGVYAPRLEPFGYSPLEANACGAPMVATAEGGVRETVQNGVTGLLVEPTIEAMASGMTRLRDDPAEARRMGERSREIAATQWSLDSAAERLQAQILSIVR